MVYNNGWRFDISVLFETGRGQRQRGTTGVWEFCKVVGWDRWAKASLAISEKKSKAEQDKLTQEGNPIESESDRNGS